MTYHKHLRSSVAGKVPTAAQLNEGQIAINFSATDPFLTIKDSAGTIRRIAGISQNTTPPATPSAGTLWLDTTRPTAPTLKVYDGTNWVVAGGAGAPASATQPTSPVKGDLWVDISGTAPVVKVYTGSAFAPVDSVVPTATTSLSGISQLATAADVTSGASDRVVTANLLKTTNAAITAGAYTLPVATTTTIGGVKAGTNITIAADGKISASVTGAITYAGALDATVAAPSTPTVDGLYVASKAGAAHSSFTGAAGATIAAGDWLLYDGAKWDHISAVAAATTPDATDTVKGILRLATNTEATTGTATNLAITPAQLKVVNDAIATATGGGITGITGTAPITASGTGATRAISISNATAAAAGAMSAADKTKLDGVAAGAEVNVQADWNEATTTSDAFIKNKPTIPAAYTLPVASSSALGGIKKGTGYTIASDGTMNITFPAALTYKGTIDPTGAAPAAKATGDVYIANKAGAAASSWTGLTPTTVSLHELLVWDGTEWAGAGVGATGTSGGVLSLTAGANTGVKVAGTATAPVVSGLDATTTVKGVVQLATDAEAKAGTDTAKAVTPAAVKAAIAALAGAAGTTAPAGPTKGTQWIDTSGATPVVKVYDGSKWVSLAGLDSPTFTGTPAGPTATAGTSSTQLATTAFVHGAVVWSRTGTTLKAKTPGDLVDVAALPAATTAANGVVRLADAAAITAGTAGRLVDAAQLKANVPTLADASATVKGIVELATAAETTTGTDTVRAVTPAGLKVELNKKAPLASPALTGTPTAPTATAATSTTQIATTAFVHSLVVDASATVKGIIELATAAEVLAGTDALKAVTPKEAKDHYLAKNIALLPALP